MFFTYLYWRGLRPLPTPAPGGGRRYTDQSRAPARHGNTEAKLPLCGSLRSRPRSRAATLTATMVTSAALRARSDNPSPDGRRSR